jgi:hypothetical protein
MEFRYRGFKISSGGLGHPHLYPVRRIGEALGFGSRGGNLSHHVRGKYKKQFREYDHYVLGKRGMIYMSYEALLVLLGLVAHDEPKRAKAIFAFLPTLTTNHKEIA